MDVIFYSVFPVFFIMIVGYVLTYQGLLETSILPSLKRLLFNFAIPILLFRSLSTANLGDANFLAIIASYYIPVIILYMFAIMVSVKFFKLSAADGAIIAMACCFSNNLLIGFPILDAMWGDLVYGPFFAVLSVHAALLWLISILVINISQQQELSLQSLFINVLQKTLLNPIVLALLLGVAWRTIFGPKLPQIFENSTKMIAQMAIPLALIMLGIQMRDVSKQDQPDKLSHAIFITISKIMILPFFVWISTRFVFGFDPDVVKVLTVMAIAPVGVNAYLLAMNYQSQIRKVAFSIFVSTIASAFVFFTVIRWFEAG